MTIVEIVLGWLLLLLFGSLLVSSLTAPETKSFLQLSRLACKTGTYGWSASLGYIPLLGRSRGSSFKGEQNDHKRKNLSNGIERSRLALERWQGVTRALATTSTS